jgi:hypothetical protein
MIPYQKFLTSDSDEFRRIFGISPAGFDRLLEKIVSYIAEEHQRCPMKKRGCKSSLTPGDMLLLTLYYLRNYPTFLNLGKMFGISESYACKIFHRISDILIKILKFTNRKELMNPDLGKIIIDVTEQPIERPVKKQRSFYSGKKKRHTVKVQIVISLNPLKILSVIISKGRIHDFRILKKSRLPLHPDIVKMGDAGYQGMQNLYPNSLIPVKKRKKLPLTEEEKKYNRNFSKERIAVEHINRRCKIFRIVKETYRNKHKNIGKIWNIIAGLVNLRYLGEI